MEANNDLTALSREQLIEEVKKLRAGIREHRDSTGHELCWHHPKLWNLLPEKTDPKIEVPEWPEFMKGCIQYRTSLDEIGNVPQTQKAYRNNFMKFQEGKGAIGALLAEYEKAIISLQHLIGNLSNEDLAAIADPLTDNPDCRSIQTVLTHVVSSAYSYAIYIRNFKGRPDVRPPKMNRNTAADYIEDLNKVMSFTADTFAGIQDSELERFNDDQKIHSLWGQVYDMEQLMEHAIVHILRHRRQVERFKMNLDNSRSRPM